MSRFDNVIPVLDNANWCGKFTYADGGVGVDIAVNYATVIAMLDMLTDIWVDFYRIVWIVVGLVDEELETVSASRVSGQTLDGGYVETDLLFCSECGHTFRYWVLCSYLYILMLCLFIVCC